MRYRGFALVELVAVIVILGIIVAIFYPIFKKEKDYERLSSCQTNLKQVGLGFAMYARDYGETLPRVASKGSNSIRPYGWADSLQPYIKTRGHFQCPSESNSNITAEATQNNYTDYWMNNRVSDASLKNVLYPASTLVSGDGNDGSDQSDSRYSLNALPQQWIDNTSSPAHRHRDMAIYLFVDGHVKALKSDKIKVKRGKSSDYHFAIK